VLFGSFLALIAVLFFMLFPVDLDCGLQPRGCAIAQLVKAREFWGAEPWEGHLATPVLAWQELFRHPDAAGAFAKILREGSPAGQLYALAGLYRSDSATFDRAIPQYLASRDSVSALISCAPSREAIAQLTAEIARGAWTKELTVGHPVAGRHRPECAT
jgi:hypothetical protein